MGGITIEPFWRSSYERDQFIAENRLVAMPRDASFERCPSTNGGQYHVIDTKTMKAKCGQPMMPNDEMAVHLHQVENWQKCRRNGCRQAWPKTTGDASGGDQ